MHRVMATNWESGRAVYLDLDACPRITVGTVQQKGPAGEIVQREDVTFVYVSDGSGKVEYVKETPEELWRLPRVDYDWFRHVDEDRLEGVAVSDMVTTKKMLDTALHQSITAAVRKSSTPKSRAKAKAPRAKR